MATQTTDDVPRPSKKDADPKHLICRNKTCRHPKSFHKVETGCSAFGCKCKVEPGSIDRFTQIQPAKKA